MFITKKLFRKIKRHVALGTTIFGGVFVLVHGFMYNKTVPRETNVISKCTSQLSETIVPIKCGMFRIINNIKSVVNSIPNNSHLILENQKLRKEVCQLRNQIQNLEKLNKCINTSTPHIFQVLGFEQNIFNSLLLIDISQSDFDVKIGYVVKTIEGLVGLVTAISNCVALVTTITDKNLFVPVKIKKKNSHQTKRFVVNGSNKNQLISVAELQNDVVGFTSGDVLYTSGEGGVFPSDIPVARVTKIGNIVEVIPIVDFDKLEFVQIIKQSLPDV